MYAPVMLETFHYFIEVLLLSNLALHPNFNFLKTKSYKKDKVNIVTLGCAKNIVDSEVLLTQLR